MADGEVTLKLGVAAVRRLKAAADAAGQPVEAFAAELISDWLVPDEGLDEDQRILDDYDQTGVSFSLEEGLAVFDTAVKRRFEPRS